MLHLVQLLDLYQVLNFVHVALKCKASYVHNLFLTKFKILIIIISWEFIESIDYGLTKSLYISLIYFSINEFTSVVCVIQLQ